MFLFIVAPYDLIGHKRQFMLDLSLEMRSLGFTSSQLHGLSTGGLFPIIRHVCVTHVGRRACSEFYLQLNITPFCPNSSKCNCLSDLSLRRVAE
jgi:hypothetical protein